MQNSNFPVKSRIAWHLLLKLYWYLGMCFTLCAGKLSWLCKIQLVVTCAGVRGYSCECHGSCAADSKCMGANEKQPCFLHTLSHSVQLSLKK